MDNDNKPTNPWKAGVIGVGGAMIILAGAGVVVAALYDEDPSEPVAVAAEKPAATVAAAPAATAPVVRQEPQLVREDCSKYLAGTRRDNSKVVKDGLVGGAIGAGLGAAGGAIADGGNGAGKGAGIGGLVGSVAGALRSNEKERERTVAAERTYNECMARNGR